MKIHFKFPISNFKFRKGLLRTILTLLLLTTMFAIATKWLSHPAIAGWSPTHTNWLQRRQLTVTNNSGDSLAATTTVAITVDTQSLYSTGKVQSDCDDLRIIYNPSSTQYTELTRYLAYPSGTTCATSTATKVNFSLQAALAAAASTTDYYMYYANTGASTPSSTDNAFDIGAKDAILVCPFDGTTTCAAGETPSTETGAIRYSGSKSALNFDGINDKVAAGNVGTGIQTVEFWVYPNSTTTKFIDLNGSAYISASSGTITATGFTSPTIYVNGTATSTIAAGAWSHVAVTTGTAINASAVNIGLISSTYFSGIMDEVRLSNTARYSAAFTPSTSPFVRDSNTKLLLHFDENGDDPRNTGKAIDDSGNGNHGTITGAKYVAGLVGVDASATDTGNVSRQSYAGHEGVFLEEGTTNKITNPSFENATYDTNWTAGSNITATVNTTAPYYKFGSNSAKIVAGGDDTFTTSINAGSTSTHALSAYVYNGTSGAVGGTVDATVAKLVYNGTAQTTTYTDMGGGWWRLTYSAAGINAAANYGVQVLSGKTVYVDGVQLEALAYATTYTDGSLGTGYAWTGTANNSTSTRTAETLQYSQTSNINRATGSVSFWYKLEKNNLDRDSFGLIGLQDNSPAAYIYGVIFYGCQWQFRFTDGSEVAQGITGGCGSQSNKQDKWQHAVFTWSNGAQYFYINGSQVLTASYTTNSTITGTGIITVGGGYGANAFRTLNGTMTDVRIYDTVLTAAETADLYYTGLVAHSENIVVDRFTDTSSTKGQNPIATWHMDEGYGSTVNDSSPNGNSLTITGPTWSQTQGSAIRSNNLKFDGSNDYLIRSSDSDFDFGTGDVSISGWYRHPSTPPAGGSADTILARYGSAGYKVYMNSSGYICFDIDDDSTWTPDDSACDTVSTADSKWHHFEAVKSGSTSLTIYIDGRQAGQDASIAATGSLNTGSSLYLGIDSDGTSNPWDGFLDEVFVYPYARSASQVKADALSDPIAIILGGPASDPLSEGLVGYWKMDESSGNAADSSGNGSTLTNNNTTTYTNGKFGNSSSYNGSNQYLNTATTISNVQTISFWANPASTTDNYMNLASGVYVNSSSGTISATGFTSPTIYVNGVISSTISASAFEAGRANGAYLTNTGKIDEARVYNRALSPKEVRDLYAFAPGPVGYWKLDENTGTTANDSSGNSNTGTWQGTLGSQWTTGKFGPAGKLNGSNNYVDNGNGSSLQIANSQTYEAWIYGTLSSSTYNFVVEKYGDTNTNGFQLLIGDLSSTKIQYGGGINGAYNGVVGNTNLSNNTWYHIAGTWDGSFLRVYLNGVLDAAPLAKSGAVPANIVDPLRIGANAQASTTYFNGKIDDVKVYNYARTPAQIAWDYNLGKPVGWWPFDECSGSVANDRSGNSNTGTITIGATGTQTSAGTCGSAVSTEAWSNGATGKFNSSLNFDGTDDVVTVANTLANAGSVSFWAYPTSTTASMLQLTASANITASSGTISATGFTSPTYYVNGKATTSPTLVASQWNHIVVTTGTAITANLIKLGLVGSTYFSGQIDDVRIYN